MRESHVWDVGYASEHVEVAVSSEASRIVKVVDCPFPKRENERRQERYNAEEQAVHCEC